jgi:hypothetical protein
MKDEAMRYQVPAVKDPETERPIPTAWRSTIKGVVDALARRDYRIESGVPGVAPVSHDTAAQIEGYIADYGAVLTELSDQSWDSSGKVPNLARDKADQAAERLLGSAQAAKLRRLQEPHPP